MSIAISEATAEAIATTSEAAIQAAEASEQLVRLLRTAPRRGVLRRAANVAEVRAAVARNAVEQLRARQLADVASEFGVEL